MMIRRFAIVGLCVTAVTAAVLAMQAFGQNQVVPRIRYREETIDRTLPDGRVERITVQVPVQENVVVQAATGLSGVPFAPQPADAEAQKLLAQEQSLAQEVRRLSGNLISIEMPEAAQAEQKVKIREKLAAIFDLQQQRRTREIAKIEERLGKLKDVLKKRDTAKDSIIDRRLESLTGGVDELGWEESFNPNFNRANAVPQPYDVPDTQPRAENVPSLSFPSVEPPHAGNEPPVLNPFAEPPGPRTPSLPLPAPVPADPALPAIPPVGAPSAAPVPVPRTPATTLIDR